MIAMAALTVFFVALAGNAVCLIAWMAFRNEAVSISGAKRFRWLPYSNMPIDARLLEGPARQAAAKSNRWAIRSFVFLGIGLWAATVASGGAIAAVVFASAGTLGLVAIGAYTYRLETNEAGD